MSFTDEEIKLLRLAIHLAKAEIRNRIATCPDPVVFMDDIDELEAEIAAFEQLDLKLQWGKQS